jgi:hypothetical protein
VIDTLSAIGEVFKGFDFPAYVVDYPFRYWLANAATGLLFGGDMALMRACFARPLHAFDLVFDRRLWEFLDVEGLY